MFSILSCGKDSPETVESVITFNLTVTSSTGGKVSSSGGPFESGSNVSITATPDSEYVFVNWSNGSTDNPLSVTVNSNQTITSNFEKRKYPLTVSITGSGTVSEKIISAGKTTTEYTSGSTIQLIAVPSDGWIFTEWSGSVSSTENPIQLTVDESKSVTANFSIIQESFISNSPLYTYPNNTVGQIINNYYFPGKYLHTDFITDNIDLGEMGLNSKNSYRMFGREGIYFDYNNDGKLDFFGFTTNFIPNYGVEKGKFVLIDNILSDSREKLYFDTNLNFGGGSIQANDFNNDGKLEIMISTQNNHENGNGGYSNSVPVKIISFNENGTIMEQQVGEPMGVHDSTCGDVDNDGDVDSSDEYLHKKN